MPLKDVIYPKEYFPGFDRSYAFSLPKNYTPRNYEKNIQWVKKRIKSDGLLIWNNSHVAYILNIRSFELDNSTKPFAGLFIPKKNLKPIIISNNPGLRNIKKIKNNFKLQSFKTFESYLKKNNFKKIEFDFRYTNFHVYHSLNKFLKIDKTLILIDKFMSQKTKIEQNNKNILENKSGNRTVNTRICLFFPSGLLAQKLSKRLDLVVTSIPS